MLVVTCPPPLAWNTVKDRASYGQSAQMNRFRRAIGWLRGFRPIGTSAPSPPPWAPSPTSASAIPPCPGTPLPRMARCTSTSTTLTATRTSPSALPLALWTPSLSPMSPCPRYALAIPCDSLTTPWSLPRYFICFRSKQEWSRGSYLATSSLTTDLLTISRRTSTRDSTSTARRSGTTKRVQWSILTYDASEPSLQMCGRLLYTRNVVKEITSSAWTLRLPEICA
jgi:hypothetical protein